MPEKGSAEQAELNRASAIKLRIRGKSYRAIATELGVSVKQAFKYVQEVLKRNREEANELAEEARDIDLARLDGAIEVVSEILEQNEANPPEHLDGDAAVAWIVSREELKLKAIDRMVKLQDRRAALLGLDAPKKSELSGGLAVAGVTLDDLAVLRQSTEANKLNETAAECEPISENELSS